MHEISAQDVKNIARFVAEQMPEYLALKNALQAESQQLRQAVATVLHDWAFDVMTGMSQKEKVALLASIKAELVRRGESVRKT
jgi:hypothetical protein